MARRWTKEKQRDQQQGMTSKAIVVITHKTSLNSFLLQSVS